MKLAFNVLTYAQFAASAVAFEIAEGAEVDTDALVDAWRHVGQLGSLTEQFLPVLSIPAEHVVGDFRDSLRSTVGIARKDLRLAADLCVVGDLGGIVEALEKAMPEVFGVADEIREAP
jgi:3-hydroxyisobutyrate dehydrogenase-like beta-hydroxyacid dehydrogenase